MNIFDDIGPEVLRMCLIGSGTRSSFAGALQCVHCLLCISLTSSTAQFE